MSLTEETGRRLRAIALAADAAGVYNPQLVSIEDIRAAAAACDQASLSSEMATAWAAVWDALYRGNPRMVGAGSAQESALKEILRLQEAEHRLDALEQGRRPPRNGAAPT